MSKRDMKFMEPSTWGDIKRGWIYECAVPFVGERPLTFLDRYPDDETKGIISVGNGEFRPNTMYEVILPLKQRKVVTISNDDICSNPDRFNVVIAPILSIHPKERTERWYKQAVDGEHPFFAYLPEEVTGRECIVVMSDVMTVHKTMLLNDKKDISEFMPILESKLEYCFQLGIHQKSIENDITDEATE